MRPQQLSPQEWDEIITFLSAEPSVRLRELASRFRNKFHKPVRTSYLRVRLVKEGVLVPYRVRRCHLRSAELVSN